MGGSMGLIGIIIHALCALTLLTLVGVFVFSFKRQADSIHLIAKNMDIIAQNKIKKE